MTGHIWRERSKGHSQLPMSHDIVMLTVLHTHLDCGSVSVLSFNSSSETSVSRMSGLDLFPYLRQKQRHRMTCRDLYGHSFKGLIINTDLREKKTAEKRKEREMN